MKAIANTRLKIQKNRTVKDGMSAKIERLLNVLSGSIESFVFIAERKQYSSSTTLKSNRDLN